MSLVSAFMNNNENNADNMFNGVTVGVVTSIDDPEKLGRVKVKLLNRNTSDNETGFLRVMTPMAGKQWGMQFLPEVGDEVLVAFSHGDVVRPYVLGSLWNKTDKVPVPIENSENNIRKIKTKCGHEIIFDDKEDKNSIEIHTPDRLKMRLDDEKSVITISDKSGNNIMKLDAKNGIINIEAEKKINIKSGNSTIVLNSNSNKVEISATQSIQLSAQQISLKASSMLDLKSDNVVNLNASGPANIKGAVVKLN